MEQLEIKKVNVPKNKREETQKIINLKESLKANYIILFFMGFLIIVFQWTEFYTRSYFSSFSLIQIIISQIIFSVIGLFSIAFYLALKNIFKLKKKIKLGFTERIIVKVYQ